MKVKANIIKLLSLFLLFLSQMNIFCDETEMLTELEEQIKEDALILLSGYPDGGLSIFYDDMSYGYYSIVDFFWAELDGLPEREAVVYIEEYIGEGCRDYYVVLYRLTGERDFQLVDYACTHGEYIDEGFMEITDLDKNQVDEILIIGDSQGTIPRDLGLLVLENNKLINVTPGYVRAGYIHMDIDGDEKEEIIGLTSECGYSFHEEDTINIMVIKFSQENGCCIITDYCKQDIVLKLGEYFCDFILSNDMDMIAHKGRSFLEHIITALRLYDISPSPLNQIQEILAESYRQTGNSVFIKAMGLKGNWSARPFLMELLTDISGDIYVWDLAEAVFALYEIGGVDSDFFLKTAELYLKLLTEDNTWFYDDILNALITVSLRLKDTRTLNRLISFYETQEIIELKKDLIIFVIDRYIPYTKDFLLNVMKNEPSIILRASAFKSLRPDVIEYEKPFVYILRDKDCLAYKWTKDVRGTGYNENGISIWALADYFYTNCFLKKLYPAEYYNYNRFACELMEINGIDDENYIVSFDEALYIPIEVYEFPIQKGEINGLCDLADMVSFCFREYIEIAGMEVYYLDDEEIKQICYTLYHAKYPFYSKPELKEKSYPWIMENPYIYFEDHETLFVYLPFIGWFY